MGQGQGQGRAPQGVSYTENWEKAVGSGTPGARPQWVQEGGGTGTLEVVWGKKWVCSALCLGSSKK